MSRALPMTRKALHALGYDVVDGKAVRASGATLPKRSRRARYQGFRNTWEMRYAAHLCHVQLAGHIQSWSYETERLEIGEGAFYTPDFPCVLPDGTKEYREVKGYKWPASIVRLKAAAKQYPDCRFVMVTYKGGHWIETGRWGKKA